MPNEPSDTPIKTNTTDGQQAEPPEPSIQEQIDEVLRRLSWLQEAPAVDPVSLAEKQTAIAAALQVKALCRIADALEGLSQADALLRKNASLTRDITRLQEDRQATLAACRVVMDADRGLRAENARLRLEAAEKRPE